MIDKEEIIRKQNEAIIKLSILMMIADRDIHDEEYKSVIEIIDKHSMYEVTEEHISDLVSEISFKREQMGLYEISSELISTLKSNKLRIQALEYLEDIMNRDNFIHEQELKFFNHIKENWNI